MPVNLAIVPLAAESLTSFGSFHLTNSLVNAGMVTGFFILVAIIVANRRSVVPKGIQNAIEAVIEILANEVEKVTGDRKRARQFFPLVATIFLVVLANNWLGLLPGTGTVGMYGLIHGEVEFIPLLRSAGSDLNFTLAIALTAVILSHLAGLRAIGIVDYVSRFFNLKGIWQSIKHGPMAMVTAVIEFGVGLLEIIGEVAKVLSLSLRLFGNVFAGEVLMTVMLGLVSVAIPIPFMFLEIIVGIVQATVFAMLTLVYLTIATTSHTDHQAEHA